MARKPETTYISALHKRLPIELHYEKTNNPYRGGMADCWYSGSHGDLWIEYKYIQKLPVRVPVEPDVSALQADWLLNRAAEGRNVAVIVGCKEGGVIIRAPAFRDSIPIEEFKQRILSRDEIAAWIISETLGEPYAARTRSSSKGAVTHIQNRDDVGRTGVRRNRSGERSP